LGQEVSSDQGTKEAVAAGGLSMDDFEAVFTLDTKYLYVALSRDFTPSEVKLWQDALDQLKKEGLLTKLYQGIYPPARIRELARPGDPYVP
jgi:hypothetical protein